MAADDLITKSEGPAGAPSTAGRKKGRRGGPARKKAKRRKKKAKKHPRRKKSTEQARRAAPETREEAARKPKAASGQDHAAAVVETHADAVEESVPATVADETVGTPGAEVTGGSREEAVATERQAEEPAVREEPDTRQTGSSDSPRDEAVAASCRVEAEVAPASEREPVTPQPESGPEAEEFSVAEELSPEEAVAMLAAMSGRLPEPDPVRSTETGRRARRPRPRGSVIMPSCKVIAFEAAAVECQMRVATTTVARLYGMIHEEGLDVQLGRVCQTVGELIGEWDSTPLGQTIVLLVNLIGAEGLLEEFLSEVPQVTEAYWIVYETLRGGVTSSKNGFLTEQRAKGRAKAVGFGPRNIVAAARSAAEAVRWRVQWGFGSKPVAKAG